MNRIPDHFGTTWTRILAGAAATAVLLAVADYAYLGGVSIIDILGSIIAAFGVVGVTVTVINRMNRTAARQSGMTDDVKALWSGTRTLQDICDLTARWLTGDVPAQPGYYGPVDVDDGDVPGMAELLAACNRAGMLTTGSQAGYFGGDRTGHWEQLASVEGHLPHGEALLLQEVLARTGVKLDLSGGGVTVTRRDGRDHTDFGAVRRDLDDTWTGYGICGPAAVAELQMAHPFVVYDPEPGRNDRLWPALAQFARHPEATRV